MKYYKKEEGKIICLLCRHSCKLKEDQIGMCGVNKDIGLLARDNKGTFFR